jgi:NAD(P)H-flavin reductase
VANEQEIAFLSDTRGEGTRGLAGATRISLLGALGRGFRIADGPALLVGGGIGAAVLPWLRSELADAGRAPRTLLGFRSPAYAVCAALVDPEAEVVLEPVLVTEPLARLLPFPGTVYACGPDPMLQAVAAVCAEHNVRCQVAMEAAMACGFGACHGCAVRIDGAWRRLCIEGPVLESGRILV